MLFILGLFKISDYELPEGHRELISISRELTFAIQFQNPKF